MCTTDFRHDPKEAARQLARLMENQLGYVDGHIDSIALRLFVQAYWSRVSVLAHAIHDGREAPPRASDGLAKKFRNMSDDELFRAF